MGINITKPWYYEQAEKGLISKVNINEVEQWFIQEKWIRDDTPKFNERWNKFKSKMEMNDEVWSYKFGGALSRRGGYAIISNGNVTSCFQTMMS